MSSRHSLFSRLVWLSGLVVLGLSLCAQPINAQSSLSPNQNKQLQTLEDNLIEALQMCQVLQISLAARNKSYDQLLQLYNELMQTSESSKATILQLQGNLSNSEISSAELNNKLNQMTSLYNDLQASLEAVSLQFNSYKKQMDQAIRDQAIEIQADKVIKVAGVTAMVLLVVNIVYDVLHATGSVK